MEQLLHELVPREDAGVTSIHHGAGPRDCFLHNSCLLRSPQANFMAWYLFNVAKFLCTFKQHLYVWVLYKTDQSFDYAGFFFMMSYSGSKKIFILFVFERYSYREREPSLVNSSNDCSDWAEWSGRKARSFCRLPAENAWVRGLEPSLSGRSWSKVEQLELESAFLLADGAATRGLTCCTMCWLLIRLFWLKSLLRFYYLL